MKKVLIVLSALFLLTFLTLTESGIAYFYNRNDDLSLRYNLWKVGLYPYEPDIFLMSLYADPNRSYLVEGKTKEQIIQIFPNAHETPVNGNQYIYPKRNEDEILWLGESGNYICLTNGVGEYIGYEKHGG